ncbi:hypothetical protein AC578_5542 [Pseudocercospora eumusae]|uniref:Uncharacterized protein n=1 Tax=Pseudocercospora eumusae TaxID=321146 RepID=A0A139H3E2_9PEZI|nr:hypothetical protein AC578_5542 [Pseudocercospora eumusae]
MFLATTDFVAHVRFRNGSFGRLLRWAAGWDILGEKEARGMTAHQLRLPNPAGGLPVIDKTIARVTLRPFGLFQEDQIQRAEADLFSLMRKKISHQYILNYIARRLDPNGNYWLNYHEKWQIYASLNG